MEVNYFKILLIDVTFYLRCVERLICILGPLLFLIYINDIVDSSDFSQLILFADDTAFISKYHDIKNNKDVLILNAELKKMYIWLCLNVLSINNTKANFIIFHSAKN